MRLTAYTSAIIVIIFAGCTNTSVVQSRYVIQAATEDAYSTYKWQYGDYWEFLAWALMDDVSAASALALTAGYTPQILPSQGTVITIPIPEEYEEATQNRMKSARLVRTATSIRETDRNRCMQLLEEACNADHSWSVPVTNITVLLLEDGKTEEALKLLAPMCHKNTPALILAGIAWCNGDTREAQHNLAEALISPSPRPEVLAAAGIVWSVTGQQERAGNVIRRLLEDPNAPSELRILALRYALMLGKD